MMNNSNRGNLYKSICRSVFENLRRSPFATAAFKICYSQIIRAFFFKWGAIPSTEYVNRVTDSKPATFPCHGKQMCEQQQHLRERLEDQTSAFMITNPQGTSSSSQEI